MSDYINLKISKGLTTKIDADVYKKLESENLLKWNAQKSGKRFYVSKNIGPKKIYLHRYIMNLSGGMCIDHINGDPLDNRKENLRVCSYRQNAMNRGPISNKFKGVSKVRNKFSAQIVISGRHLNIGYFDTETDAARAYDIVAAFVFRDFGYFNFPFSKKFIKFSKIADITHW